MKGQSPWHVVTASGVTTGHKPLQSERFSGKFSGNARNKVSHLPDLKLTGCGTERQKQTSCIHEKKPAENESPKKMLSQDTDNKKPHFGGLIAHIQLHPK